MKKPFNSQNLTYFVLTGIGLEKINRGGTHSMCSYVDYAGAFGSPGATVRYVTSRDDRGRDRGKNYTATNKEVALIVHNIQPKKIFVNGQEQIYKTFHNPMEIPVTWTKGSQAEIKIEY